MKHIGFLSCTLSVSHAYITGQGIYRNSFYSSNLYCTSAFIDRYIFRFFKVRKCNIVRKTLFSLSFSYLKLNWGRGRVEVELHKFNQLHRITTSYLGCT